MARRGRGREVAKAIESTEALEKAIADSETMLVVLDIHSDWVGPCVVMQPMYESLTLALESWESRLRILTVNKALLTDAHKERFGVEESSKPYFVVIKQQVVLGKIAGANAPELRTIMTEHVPAAPSKDS
ncbi:hypothetical protein FNF27_03512 [Cafeteria roenbergensis]|uniref:Thioredoxin domain-containing protein n=1 Tax=Cafeteria roenbergensis TaxID=33653 RepID=A0A5A8CSE7_CAFRO|nr:hypothetical protein FNF29_02290 [Cafeteria roenbergensis]KAA0160575.1 hypothetical protein FNF28_05411 [Cafeteria roenbergensis]KAA0161596.1 hypothetical protein FNF31_03710 [Cafeteria roenbergensis]KAA0174980.1 hypothetical protein FNF27_03512 [Cafeteria roenbergensis]|eukprot:KAA0154761.1 hypothetical protein FNF29_02290 [Cafeteria roenbergensis]